MTRFASFWPVEGDPPVIVDLDRIEAVEVAGAADVIATLVSGKRVRLFHGADADNERDWDWLHVVESLLGAVAIGGWELTPGTIDVYGLRQRLAISATPDAS